MIPLPRIQRALGLALAALVLLTGPAALAQLNPFISGFGPNQAANGGGQLRVAEGEYLQVYVYNYPMGSSFQWLRDGTALPGKTEPRLEFEGYAVADAGVYSARVTFGAQSATTASITVSILPGLRISQSPQNPVLEGTAVTLTASAPGAGAVSGFVWRHRGMTVAGATNAALGLPAINLMTGGRYSVSAFYSALNRTVSSEHHRVGVYATFQKPIVVTQPRDQIARPSGPALTSVGVSGTGPFSYQWQMNGVDLGGETNFYLYGPQVGITEAASYRVIVRNAAGSVTSAPMTLTITNPAPLSATATALVGSGRAALTQHTNTSLSSATATFGAAVGLDPNHPLANLFYGITRVVDLVHQAPTMQFLDRLQVGATNRDIYHWTAEPPQTAEGDLKMPNGVNAAELPAFLRDQLIPQIRAARENLARISDAGFLADVTEAETGIQTVTLDQADLHVIRAGLGVLEFWVRTVNSWNVSAQLTDLENLGNNDLLSMEQLLSTYPQAFAYADPAQVAPARAALEEAIDTIVQAWGLMRVRSPDVVRLFSLDPEHGEADAVLQFVLDLKASLNQPVVLNDSADLAPGIDDPTQYQVRLGALLDGSQAPRTLLPGFVGNQPDASRIQDPTFGGALVSRGEPRIILGPVDHPFRLGDTFDLGVAAIGAGPLRYQWYVAGVPIPGETNALLSLNASSFSVAGNYEVRVQNAFGESWSGGAWVEPDTRPFPVEILVHPVGMATLKGGAATFHSVVASEHPVTLQWYHDGRPLAGETGSVLRLLGTQPAAAGAYQIAASTIAGTAWSRPAELRVVDAGPGTHGAMDPSFSPPSFKDNCYPVRVTRDESGRLLWTFANGGWMDGAAGEELGNMVRTSADGAIDRTFRVTERMVRALAVAPLGDGRMLVGAALPEEAAEPGLPKFRIFRLDTQGRVDPAYRSPVFRNPARFLTLDPEGRLLVGISAGEGVPNGGINTLVRLNPNGSLDRSFREVNMAGPFGPSSLFANLVVDSQRRILMGGYFTAVNGVSRPGIARLFENGELDFSFNPTGFAGTASPNVRSILLQSSGRIVLAGRFTVGGGTTRYAMVRLLDNGTLDGSFNLVTLANAGLSAGMARLALALPDGRILAVGGTVARFTADGALDSSFSRPSLAFDSPATTECFWMTLQPDGKVIVPANTTLRVNGTAVGSAFRLNADGSLDRSFSAPRFEGQAPLSGVSLRSDGRALVWGAFDRVGTQARPSVALIHADGSPSAAPDLSALGNVQAVASVAMVADGSFYAWLGQGADDVSAPLSYSMRRFLPDGSLDTGFALDNSLAGMLAAGPAPQVVIHQGQPLLVRNTAEDVLNDQIFMRRLTSQGGIDPGFIAPEGSLGWVERIGSTLHSIYVNGFRVLRVLGDGRFIVAVGNLNEIDPTWPYEWTLYLVGGPTEPPLEIVGARTPGAYPVETYMSVADPANGQTVQVRVIAPAPTDMPFRAAAMQSDGSILVAGNFTLLGTNHVSGLARFRPDRSYDASFATHGKGVEKAATSVREAGVESLLVDGSNRIWIAGGFDSVNGVPRGGVARLGSNGEVDEAFVPEVAGADYVGQENHLALAADGAVWVSGSFQTASDAGPLSLVRLVERTGPSAVTLQAVLGAEGCVINITGAAGGPWTVQWSEDLVRWTDLQTIANFGGSASIVDPIVAGRSLRFYQAIRR
jgi:uncharacterized delta-60 repeat protein